MALTRYQKIQQARWERENADVTAKVAFYDEHNRYYITNNQTGETEWFDFNDKKRTMREVKRSFKGQTILVSGYNSYEFKRVRC